jgi:hypothetical protein
MRSQDLTPLLWDQEKSVAYQSHEKTIQELKEHIMKSTNLQEISFTGFRSHASGMCLHDDDGHLKIY